MGKGRVTIPTDLDVVPQTLEMIEEWGADAIRDCDGTEFPQKLKDTGAKIYAMPGSRSLHSSAEPAVNSSTPALQKVLLPKSIMNPCSG